MKLSAFPISCLLLLAPEAAHAVTTAPGEKGIDINWMDAPDRYSATDEDRALTDVHNNLGASWVRYAIPWGNVQAASPAAWDWSHPDRDIPAIVGHGLKPMVVLTFCTPSWANGNAGCQKVPTNLTYWRAFVRNTVARYAPKGVHAWEIFNEVNFQNSASSYGPVLKAAFEEIRAVDPGAEVITSGITLDGGSGVNYVQSLYNLGYGADFTAVGVHPYDYVSLPSSSSGNWAYLDSRSPNLRQVMTAAGDSGKKIWLTEYGYASCNPTNSGWTEQRETQFLTDAYKTAQAKAWAGPLFWYSYRDDGASCASVENKYGLLRYDWSRKPAYAAYQAVPGGTTPTPPDMTAFVADLTKLQTAAEQVKTTADLSSLDALIAQLQTELQRLEGVKAALAAKTRRLP